MTREKPFSFDVSACDREPIHIPGSIQPHGLLLSLNPSDLSVIQASTNTVDMLGLPMEQVLGKTLSELLAQEDAASLTQLIEGTAPDQGTAYLQTLKAPVSGRFFSVSAHRVAHALILELELSDPPAPSSFNQIYKSVIRLPEVLSSAPSLDKAATIAANEMRKLTGFERVLVIKFAPDWNGHVIAESRVEDIQSFMDLWFPASDIPAQVRKLYEMNRIRVIADSSAMPVSLFPPENPRTGKPLDMSLSVLRSVSPVHLEYMRNMDVGGSVSMSLLGGDGRLWGLISCHHRKPMRLSIDVRTACEIMARMLATQIERVEVSEHRASMERALILRSLSTRLAGFLAGDEHFVKGLRSHPEELLSFVHAGGAAIVAGGVCARLGNCPAEEDVRAVVRWLAAHCETEVFETARASSLLPNGAALSETASGILAVALSEGSGDYLLWFRPELVKTVRWGGDPRKTEGQVSTSGLLNPRKSFEAWQETIKSTSKSWSEGELEAAFLLRDSIASLAVPVV